MTAPSVKFYDLKGEEFRDMQHLRHAQTAAAARPPLALPEERKARMTAAFAKPILFLTEVLETDRNTSWNVFFNASMQGASTEFLAFYDPSNHFFTLGGLPDAEGAQDVIMHEITHWLLGHELGEISDPSIESQALHEGLSDCYACALDAWDEASKTFNDSLSSADTWIITGLQGTREIRDLRHPAITTIDELEAFKASHKSGDPKLPHTYGQLAVFLFRGAVQELGMEKAIKRLHGIVTAPKAYWDNSFTFEDLKAELASPATIDRGFRLKTEVLVLLGVFSLAGWALWDFFTTTDF
jgi:hypothetical protein